MKISITIFPHNLINSNHFIRYIIILHFVKLFSDLRFKIVKILTLFSRKIIDDVSSIWNNGCSVSCDTSNTGNSVLTFLAEAKNDFSSYNKDRSGKIKLLEAALYGRKLHGIGVNNGDVTAGRRTTERQDNGLLSLFSVLTAPPPSFSCSY